MRAYGVLNMPNEEVSPKRKPPREGFRRRINPYYAGMTKKEIAIDTSKTVLKWLCGTAFLYIYWAAMLLLFSILLLNVWKVTLVRLLIYAGVLCGISSAAYAGILVHRKFYY